MSAPSEALLQLQTLMQTQEPLARELEMFLDRATGDRATVRHPLLYAVPYFEVENALLNRRLAKTKQRLAEALADGSYNRAVFLHERPHRVNALVRCAAAMSDRDYWQLVGNVWTDTENYWQSRAQWSRLFTGKGRNQKLRPLLMDRDERRALAALPETLTVYRGVARLDAVNGLAWTLDLSRARWFASRLLRDGHTPMVYKRVVSRNEVAAHFTRRGESEIVLLSRGKPTLAA